MKDKILEILKNKSSLLSNNDYDCNIIYDEDFDDIVNSIYNSVILEVLDDYTKFLLKEGYTDTDVYCEEPTALDQFLNTK